MNARYLTKKNLLKVLPCIILSAVLTNSTNAMEFGVMGNVSASMGGAGVALKSPFGLYYNPALIASEQKTRIGYSVSAGMEQSNLDKLTNINFDETMKVLANVGGSLGGNSIGGSSPDSITGALTNALQNVTGSTGNTNLETLWKDYQNQQNGSTDYSELASALQSSINNSNMSQGDKDMFNGMADSIDWEKLDIAGSNITNLSIKKGSNIVLDEAMQNLDTLFQVLKNNNMNVRSQNGFVFQFSNKTIDEKFGAVAIGIFNSTQAGVSLVGDDSKMRLIFGSDNSYYELEVSDGGYTIKQSTRTDYDNFSLLASINNGNSHRIVSSVFALTEIPIGYAYNFKVGNSNISLGAAFKLMNGISIFHETYLSSNLSFDMNFGSNTQIYTTFGFDLGAYYGYNINETNQFALGVVVKNINSPTFRFNNSPNVVIDPQYRMGIAYNGKIFSLAFDADLAPNRMLNYSYGAKLSQMIGGGAKIDFKHIDLRAGLAYDLKQDNGVILTAGINILGFIDIATEVGTKWVDYFGFTAPKYASVRIGGSFSW
ncbi:hypothetical protein CQA53_08425 [Helicobacter didelphidarum]|uniref:Conjugal transfer protein TraF n=1 Tax=Helicobacter didelphidarum TaxID=2040648 RepID=A0A3D8IEJ8_9HELI|nr:conjugal transfer protein TraF [Helicobacter didelphidarum]RDU63582.1 hypothetical protein CQA53_08425 [Helicobacter didelphidarum]